MIIQEGNRQRISRHPVLQVGVDAVTMKEAVSEISSWQKDDQSRFVVTVNAEMVIRAHVDKQLASSIAAADLVVPDGAGIVWAGEQLHLPFTERVAGIDLMVELLATLAASGDKVYFLGGRPGVAKQAAQEMQKRYPQLCFAGVRDGYFTDDAKVIADIKASEAKLLLVGLGVPKQEKWIYQHYQSIPGITAIGIGGAFDVLSGMLSRAPLWMQRHRLEWLYRLCRQPSRLMRMTALPRFVWEVKRAKKKGK